MSDDLNVDNLEETTQTETVVSNDDKKAAKAEAKAEAVAKGAEMLVEKIGVSDEMGKLIDLAKAWDSDKETKDEAKASAIEAFGGNEALKKYATEKMEEELAEFRGLDKINSVLNNIKHFYAKRANSGRKSKSVATSRIKIADEFYSVSTAYLAEISDEDAVTKRQLVLDHPQTVKEVITEL